MEKLRDILLKDEGIRLRLVREMASLVEHEVAGHRGVVGYAVRGSFRFITSVRSNLVQQALDDMIDAFVTELDALYSEHGRPQGFADFMIHHKARIADRMVSVTDSRRGNARNIPLCRAYDRLSPYARSSVERSIPRLSQVVQRYVDELAAQQTTLAEAV